MEADFDGQLQDIQADPEADSDEDPGSDAEERLEQVSIHNVCLPGTARGVQYIADQMTYVFNKSREQGLLVCCT